MKYRLIKLLPFENSPKIGYISKSDEIQTDGSHYWNGLWFEPKNYPEFWEKIVEEDYEILSYCENDNVFNVKDNSKGILNRLGLKIHSVKRLSDSEIFTIGDKISSSSFTKLTDIDTIKQFYICTKEYSKIWNNIFNKNALIIGTNKSWQSNLHLAIKVKIPLFTTEDGIEIFEGDLCVTITNNFNYGNESWKPTLNNLYQIKGNNLKIFSSKEKAEEYILMNKPVLSLKDVANIYISADKPITDTTSFSAQNRRIQDLVKSKIQQSV